MKEDICNTLAGFVIACIVVASLLLVVGCKGLKVRADHGSQGTDINIHVPPPQSHPNEEEQTLFKQ